METFRLSPGLFVPPGWFVPGLVPPRVGSPQLDTALRQSDRMQRFLSRLSVSLEEQRSKTS